MGISQQLVGLSHASTADADLSSAYSSRCTSLIVDSLDKISSMSRAIGSSAAIFPTPLTRCQIDRRFSTMIRYSPSSLFALLSELPLMQR
jgi:hypothetical protein